MEKYLLRTIALFTFIYILVSFYIQYLLSLPFGTSVLQQILSDSFFFDLFIAILLMIAGISFYTSMLFIVLLFQITLSIWSAGDARVFGFSRLDVLIIKPISQIFSSDILGILSGIVALIILIIWLLALIILVHRIYLNFRISNYFK